MDRIDVIAYSALVVSVILHEVSHGVVALWYGDDTAKRAGRITLNPLPHIDPVGSVLLPAMAILAGVPALGWAKPVPVDPGKLRNPRRQMLWVGLVGPFTNFALMLAAAVVARSMFRSGGSELIFDIAMTTALVNVSLGVFNMLPIPPLDGSSLIERVLPTRWLPGWYNFRPYGFLVLFVGLFWFDVFARIIDPFWNALIDFVTGR